LLVDHEFRKSLSRTAIKAGSLISRIRSEELESIWSTSASPSLNSEELFPGMMFNIAKPALESTKLWKIVKKMPKGTLLHCHLGAMVDLNWVFTEALNTKGMCISSDVPLVDDLVRNEAGIRYRYSKSAHLEENPSIWSSEYVSKTWIPIMEAADSFPGGGRNAFIAWMKDRCSITQAESLQHHLGVDDVWRKLDAAFSVLPGIVYYEPIMRKFLKKFFTTLLEDGVRWVEFRTVPFTDFYTENTEAPTTDPGVLLGVLNEEIEAFKISEAGKGFWGARMIWSSIRFWPTKKVVEGKLYCQIRSWETTRLNFS
jgi:adenosine deaminase CECR1